MKIAITGEKGFLGYHLTQYFKWIKNYEVISLGRNYLNKVTLLKDCDLLIHCAGVNKDMSKDMHLQNSAYYGNVTLAEELVEALDKHNISINIKFTSSTQEYNNNDYGKSKILAGKILEKYCANKGTVFQKYKIPNIFGPFGKHNYNSFINTFCYNIVNDIPCNYNNALVPLSHVYDVARVIDDQTSNYNVYNAVVSDVYFLIKELHESYSKGIIPNLKDNFTRNLFNTYRGFTKCLFEFHDYKDSRGNLMELVKSKGSPTQIFYSTTKPGITRGEHFHFSKIERFCILKGEAKVTMRKIGTNTVKEYYIDGDSNKVIDMPVLHTHDITNVGKDDLICVFWVDEIYDHSNPDTYYEKVKK